MLQMKTAERQTLREQPTISPRNTSDSDSPPPRILKIKISRDSKVFFRGINYPLFDLLSFLFLLTISRPPPGVCENKRTPSHFTRHQTPRTLIHRPTAFDAQAEPSRQREPGHELDQPIADAASYPQSSESLPEPSASTQE